MTSHEEQEARQIFALDNAAATLGIKLDSITNLGAGLSMLVTEHMVNGYGVCHGGCIFTLADTALAFACISSGDTCVTTNAAIEFINPATLGDQLIAIGKVSAKKSKHYYCDVSVVNQHNTTIAICRGHLISIGKRVALPSH